MSKREMARELWRGTAYLATGIALIVGSLLGLGIAIDFLAGAYPDGMPVVVSLMPLFLMLVALGWGGTFIWRSTTTSAGEIAFYLLGTALYKTLRLHRVSIRQRNIGAIIAVLAGLVMFLAEIIPAGIRAWPEIPGVPAHPSIAVIGMLLVLLGASIGGYKPGMIPQKGCSVDKGT